MSICNEVPVLHLRKSRSAVGAAERLGMKYNSDEVTDVREVDRDTLEPILFLLQNPDIEVQRAASAALGNLAVNSALLTCPLYLNRLTVCSREQGRNCPAWRIASSHPTDDVP